MFGKHPCSQGEVGQRERESLKHQPKSSGKLPLYKGVGVALPAHGVKERGEESRIVPSSRKKGRKK